MYRGMAGFLDRAKQWRLDRKDAKASSSVRDTAKPLTTDETETFPEEERRGILAEIDQIVSENKKALTPERLFVDTGRIGVRFPLLVNVIALLVLVAGIYVMLQLYREEEQAVRTGGGIVLTTESRLISELQRQTDEQLQRKEQEISAIQAQLAEVQSERIAIETEIDQRVRELERELRDELDAELQAERRRLINEGFSDEEIEQLLRDFERRRLVELRVEVDAYRVALEREQQESANALARLEMELSQRLEDSRRERAALEEDARRRVSELRHRYEQQLESRSEEVARARARLSELQELQESQLAVQHQIAGYYQRIRSAVVDRDYADASMVINRLRDFLEQESVRSLPMMETRYEAERYILESLARLVEPQIGAGDEDGEQLLARAQRMTEVSRLLEAAAREREEGALERAESLSLAAFELLPHGVSLHEFLAGPDHETVIEQVRREFDLLMETRVAELASEYEQEIAGLELEMTRVEETRDQALAALEEAEAVAQRAAAQRIAESRAVVPEADPDLRAELLRLRRIEQELTDLRSLYAEFREKEAQLVLDGEDPFALVEGKLLLDSFLGSSGVQELFPDLDGRIRRYDQAFQATGRRAAILDTLDIVYTLAEYTDEAERRAYLLEERSRTADPHLGEFLDELVALVDSP